MSSHEPLVALIHGVESAIAPAQLAIAREFSNARVWNLLDDRLIEEVHERGGVTPELLRRMRRLIQHAEIEGADGILITCSLYSFAAATETAEASIPVLGADSAAFHDVIAARPSRILLVSSVETALVDSTQRLQEVLDEHHSPVEIVPVFVSGALEASRQTSTADLERLIVAAVTPLLAAGDVVLFGQYSISPAAAAVEQLLGTTVFTGPARAARELRAAIEHPDHRRHPLRRLIRNDNITDGSCG